VVSMEDEGSYSDRDGPAWEAVAREPSRREWPALACVVVAAVVTMRQESRSCLSLVRLVMRSY
jgi:hypothetical protein